MVPKIVFIHPLNNYSGSPRIGSVVVRNLVRKHYSVEVITSSSKGFLSDIDQVRYHSNWYHWSRLPLITILAFVISQIRVFTLVLFRSGHDTIFYLNTITSPGAAIACKLTHKQFVYHVHEDMGKRTALYHLFRYVYRLCNERSIFVSRYLVSTAVEAHDFKVIYNALEEEFFERAQRFREKRDPLQKEMPFSVLMVSSLNPYKGIYEFAELARRIPDYSFTLILSASQKAVEEFRQRNSLSQNLRLYSVQTDLHPFYQHSRVLLQLTQPDHLIETFGLTLLEAMYYGIPAIAPNIGGPTELIDEGVNGYLVNPLDLTTIEKHIRELAQDPVLYQRLSQECVRRSEAFREEKMIREIIEYITK